MNNRWHVNLKTYCILRLDSSFKDSLFICTFRKIFGNGTLYFPPFLAQYYRADIHEAVYRCRATNEAGTILSRNMQVQAGKRIVCLHVELNRTNLTHCYWLKRGIVYTRTVLVKTIIMLYRVSCKFRFLQAILVHFKICIHF